MGPRQAGRGAASVRAHPEPDLAGRPEEVRHRVEAGQTLYRIAVSYGLEPQVLARANGIQDPTSLAVGQVLRIPGVQQPRRILAVGEPVPATPERGARPGPAARSSPGPGLVKAERSRARAREQVSGRASPSVRRPGPLSWPLRGVLYARYGKKGTEPHDGIDLAAPEGTPVRTADAGLVLFAGEQKGYGNIVIVEHATGLITLYAHNRDLRVRTGQTVRDGQVVATVGQSGRTSGPHLHFEVRKDGRPVDPMAYLGSLPPR